MILKRSRGNTLRIFTQDQCTKKKRPVHKEEPTKCVSGAAITICYYLVQISTNVVPQFFWVAMRLFFSVDCLATIAKHCFVCFFGPGSKEQNNDHVYNEL